MASPVNPFDLIEQGAPVPQAAPGPRPPAGYELVDPAKYRAPVPPPKDKGVARNVAARLSDAAIDATIVPPAVDLVTGAMRAVGLPVSQKPIMGTTWVKDHLPASMNPDLVQPQTAAERIAGGAAYGAGLALTGGAGVGGLEKAGLSGLPLHVAKEYAGKADIPNTIIGAGAGAAGAGAQEAVPDKYKPVAGVVGSLIGGHAGAEGAGLAQEAHAAEQAASIDEFLKKAAEADPSRGAWGRKKRAEMDDFIRRKEAADAAQATPLLPPPVATSAPAPEQAGNFASAPSAPSATPAPQPESPVAPLPQPEQAGFASAPSAAPSAPSAGISPPTPSAPALPPPAANPPTPQANPTQGLTPTIPPPAPAQAAPPQAALAPPPGFEFVNPPSAPNSAPSAPITTGAASQKPRQGAPRSLIQFLRDLGGVQDEGGNLRSRDYHRKFIGLINNKNGVPLDKAREAAAEAGYMGADTERAVSESTVNDLLDHIDNHPTYSVHDEDRVLAAQERATLRNHSDKIRDDLVASGLPDHEIDRGLLRKAAEAVHYDGVPLHDAWEHAIMAEHYADGDRAKATKAVLPEVPWDDFTNYTEGKFDDSPPELPETDAAPVAQSGSRNEGPSEEGSGPGEKGEPRSVSQEPDESRAPEGHSGEAGGKRDLAVDKTEAGNQTVIPGAEKIDDAKLAQRLSDQNLKPKVNQKDTDGLALFGDGHKQSDLLDTPASKPEPKAEPKPEAKDTAPVDLKVNEPTPAPAVERSGLDLPLSIKATKHTKQGHDLFVVQNDKRVERPIYDRLAADAKKLGGWYSAYARGGAIPGFQFKNKEAAEQFVAVHGPVPSAAKPESTAEPSNAAAKINTPARLEDEQAELTPAHTEATKPVTPAEYEEKPLVKSGASVIKFPTGRFGYVGSVPDSLAFVEGSTPEQISEAKKFGVRFGPKQPKFAAAEEAVDYAKQRGFAVHNAEPAQAPAPTEKVEANEKSDSHPSITVEHRGRITAKMAADRIEWRSRVGQYRAIATRHRPWSVEDGFGDTPEEAEADARRKVEPKTEHPGLVIKSLETGEETHVQPKGTVAPKTGENATPDKNDKKIRNDESPAESPSAKPDSLADKVAAHFGAGHGFENIIAARKFVAENGGRGLGPKAMEEAIEHGVVKAARSIVHAGSDPDATYRDLVALYSRQPNLSTRTSTSVEQQAYSTPAPLAYLASRGAGITPKTSVYEPTAGNGMLLIAANPKNVVANELNPDRASTLKEQGFKTTGYDASAHDPGSKFDSVIANPPFGVVKENGSSKIFDLAHTQPGYRTSEIDHAIALQALRSMKQNGRASLILGGVNKLVRTDQGRADAYNGKAKREFFHVLYNNYNVVDHYTVAGELYSRQGAAYPVDVIVIHGRGKSSLPVPSVSPPKVYSSWDKLKEKLNEPDRPALDEGEDRLAPSDAPVPGKAGAETALDGRRDEPAPPRQPSASGGSDGQSRVIRRGHDSGQSGSNDSNLGPRENRVRPESRGDDGRPDEPNSTGPVRRLAPEKQETETEGQVAYRPASVHTRGLGTLVPRNMRTSTQDALDRLAKAYGSTDSLVSQKLGMSTDDLKKYFAAEQVDALALALHNLSKGDGFIIGDQTGIGKGRVNAAILRYAIHNGYTPVFVTEKLNLYGDMYRDLKDIGIEDYLGRQPRILMTDANAKVSLDDEGKLVLKSPAAKEHNQALLALANKGGLEDHDMVFTTYSQMQTVKGESTPRQQFLKSIAPGSILVLDESHNAGGTVTERPDPNAPPNRAEFVRDLVNAAKGVFYSSATYAKRPDVMDLYSKTDMRKAVKDIKSLAEAISSGGVPMQQAVAAELAKAGQYIRRERSFAGVTYETRPVATDHKAYEDFSHSLALINDFSDEMQEAVKHIDREIRDEAASISPDGSTGGAGASSTNFTSIMHNLVSQLLLAQKAKAAVDVALESLKANEKPVLTVANTMESFLSDFADSNDLKPGDPVTMNFRDLLQRYLDRTRTISIKKPFSKEKAVKKYLTDSQLGPLGVIAYKRAQEAIRAALVEDLPISPIDYIKDKLAAHGYKVGEITGRGSGISYSGDVPRYYVRPQKEVSPDGRRKTIAEFNKGGLDAMVLNRAGSTGLSLHASKDFEDRRQRHMIMVQPEENIDTHMQMLGRIHRTGQVVLPKYTQLVADIPAEKRPAAVLAKKMASLNASTTASRKGALTASDIPDFMNEYGDLVAAAVMRENPDISAKLGDPLPDSADGIMDGAMRKVTGRIPLLPIKEQEQLYKVLEDNYADLIAEKDAAGENALEAKNLDLDAKTLSTEVVKPGEGDSPFTAPVVAESVDVKKQSKPYKTADLIDDLSESTGHELASSPDDLEASVAKAASLGAARSAKTLATELDKFTLFRKQLVSGLKNEATRELAETKFADNERRFKEIMERASVGDKVTIKTGEENFTGIVTKVQRTGDTQNPIALGSWKVTVAVPGRGPMQYSFSKLLTSSAPGFFEIESAARESTKDMLTRFDEMSKHLRENRVILTGNMLAAYDFAGRKGQIVNYTDHEGAVRQGLLMPTSMKKISEVTAGRGTPITNPSDVLDYMESTKKPLTSLDSHVSIHRDGRGLYINVPASKALGSRYYLDKTLRDLTGDFVRRGSSMRAQINLYGSRPIREREIDAIRALQGLGAKFERPYVPPQTTGD